MSTMAVKKEETHWKDRLIARAEAISDAFDVAKAYGAHIANWVLFFCLIANLIEMVSPAFQAMAGMVIVGIQSIMLDIAGFGLTAMAASARRRGDNKSALKADIMGWTLISVMAITVTLITLAAFWKDWAPTIEQADNWLILTRIIVTVFYGHLVHQIREEGAAHENRLAELETAISDLQSQLHGKEQEVSNAQGQLSGVQKTFSGLQQQLEEEKEKVAGLLHKLELVQQRASSLETELETGHGDTASLHRDLNAARMEADILRGKLDLKSREVEEMSRDQAGIISLRRELNSAKVQSEDLQIQLEAKQQALKNEQLLVANLRQEVERFQQNEAKMRMAEARFGDSSEAPRRKNEAKSEAVKHTTEAPKRSTEAPTNPGLLRLPSNADRAAKKAEALRLIDEEHMTTYKAAEITSVPAGTIQRWLSERKNSASVPVSGEAREA